MNLCVCWQSLFRYLVDGTAYKFELENLDLSLRWLKDQALERRKQELTFKSTNPHMLESKKVRKGGELDCARHFMAMLAYFTRNIFLVDEYILEQMSRPNKVLKLDKPISSAGTLEFLLLRKNSILTLSITRHFQALAETSAQTQKSTHHCCSRQLPPRPVELVRASVGVVFSLHWIFFL